MMLRRRTFLGGGVAAVVGAGLPFSQLFTPRARAQGFGPLEADPDGILDLPAGFTYRVVEETGGTMSDGYRVSARPDGMAAFEGAGGAVVLMRNHEVSDGAASEGPYFAGQDVPGEAYTSSGMGGVTRVVLDGSTFERVSSNLVLAGTVRNCAGGPSPWGWLSCEENTSPGHGYVFVCPSDAESIQPAQRVVGYGRFNHEAVAVDPRNHVAYLTEDRADGCLYRFVPSSMAAPFEGRLQAMRIVGMAGFDTGTRSDVGVRLEVEWVDIDEPDPSSDTVRFEASDKGAAIVRRGEGIWYADGAVYFSATSGGPIGRGQIFRFEPDAAGDGGRLVLVAHSDNSALLDKPDNIAMAPWGDLFICEDGDGENFLRVLSADGTLSTFARNAMSSSELAGVCFSPDGRALFVNLQADGLTLAVTGPFAQAPPPGDGGVASDGGAVMGGPDGGVAARDAAAARDASHAGAEGGAGSDGPGAAGDPEMGGGGCAVGPAPSRNQLATALGAAAVAATAATARILRDRPPKRRTSSDEGPDPSDEGPDR